MASKPMKEFCGKEIQPGKEYKSDKELLNFIKLRELQIPAADALNQEY